MGVTTPCARACCERGEAVHRRQEHVEDADVEALAAQAIEGGLGVADADGLEALFGEAAAQHLRDFRVVLDHQDAHDVIVAPLLVVSGTLNPAGGGGVAHLDGMRAVAAALIGWCAVARAEPPGRLGLAEVLRAWPNVGPDQAVARATVPIAAAEVRTARMFPNPALNANAGRAEPIVAGVADAAAADPRAARRARARRRARRSSRRAWSRRWRSGSCGTTRASPTTRSVRADEELAIARQVEALTRRVAEIAAERYDAGAGSMLEKLQAQLVEDRAAQDLSDRAAVAARGAARAGAARRRCRREALPPLADALAAVGADAGARRRCSPRPSAPIPSCARSTPSAWPPRRGRAPGAPIAGPSSTLELGVELLDATTCGNPEGGARCVGPRGALSFDLPVFNLNGGPIARAEAEARAATLQARRGGARASRRACARPGRASTAATTRARFFEARYVPAATQVEAMAREGFAAGRTGLLPLIEAQRALLDSRLGQAEARFAVQAARADLEEASGVALSAP